MKVSIIGSAGRKDDQPLMSRQLWTTMLSHATLALEALVPDNQELHLMSGGAALANHVAVALFLNKVADRLTLHLPAKFRNSKFVETSSKFDAGRTTNYYHKNFRHACNVDGLREIQRAIDEGAETTTGPGGFKARNLLVADCDLLIAYTFGTDTTLNRPTDSGWKDHRAAGLKDGGTAHTWNNSNARRKLHTNLKAWTHGQTY